MITVKIYTKIGEIKEFWETHKSKRIINNRKVIFQLRDDIYKVLSNGYWGNDISDYFKENMGCHGEKYLANYFSKALKNLK